MRVVVTGGAGFIGSRICEAHLDRGDEVLSIDDMSGATSGPPCGARSAVIDISNSDEIRAAIAEFRPDVVSHHAALVSVKGSAVVPDRYAAVNVAGTVNVLRACIELAERPMVIFASSGGTVYGEPVVMPIPEHAPKSPISVYGVSKLAAERFVDLFRERWGVPSATLRYGNVYGPGQRSDREFGVIAIFVDRMMRDEVPHIFGNGTKTRDYVHIDDVVSANLKAVDGEWSGAYNVGTGISTTDLGLFDMVASKCGFGLGPRFVQDGVDEVQNVVLDCTRAKRSGWEASVELSCGIDDTIIHFGERFGP